MRIRPSQIAAFLIAWTAPAVALAQQANPNCPPGGWFCEESSPPETAPAPPPALPPPTVTPPPAASAPAQPAPGVNNQGGTTVIVNNRNDNRNENKTPPPIVIYQQAPPPPPPVYVIRRPPPKIEMPPAPPPQPRWRRWGINLRLEGVAMDDKANKQAGMAGAGISFRARPVPYFGLDFGLDALGGKDYQGYQRSEIPFTINAMLYVNPRSRVQFYMLAGLGWSTARVQRDYAYASTGSSSWDSPNVDRYSYFGGQAGAGLEIRVTQPVSLNFDVIGFIRGRTDAAAKQNPEFMDDTGRTTNTSGGGLFRAGITFYW